MINEAFMSGNDAFDFNTQPQFQGTVGSNSIKPRIVREQVAEISTMRNQMKLIKARSHNKDDKLGENRMESLNDELQQLNFSGKNIQSGKDTLSYTNKNSKPMIPKTHTIPPNNSNKDEELKFTVNEQTNNMNRNPFLFKNQPIEQDHIADQQKETSGPIMINMNRRRRDDDGSSNKKVGSAGLELFLLDNDQQVSKINVIKQQTDFQLNVVDEISKQQSQNLEQLHSKQTLKQQISSEEKKAPFIPYIPSIGDVVAEKQKRNTAPGSRNALDDKPAVAQQEKVEEQLKNAELQQFAEETELEICPEGCGRSFTSIALERHIKVCKAVFQAKRNEFNSKNHRIVTQDQQKLQRQGVIKDKQNQKQLQKTQVGGKKWKEQSEQLRNVVQNKNQQDDAVKPNEIPKVFSKTNKQLN